ncbi:Hypothetical protein HVR_LOCUS566 [uncultured virus]|nr:Hypothetical protein HVR_LOCUS566 [uncultured virus]
MADKSQLTELKQKEASQLITITYNPLSIGDVINSRKERVGLEELFGIMIMAYVITSNNGRIKITQENDEVVNLSQTPNLPYITQRIRYPYNGNFGGNIITNKISVGFNSMEFIQGAIRITLLFGINPASVITDITLNGTPINIEFDRYFAKMAIPNFTDDHDGIVIGIDTLKHITNPKFVDSFVASIINCFPEITYPGVTIPSNLYFISSQPDQSDVIATIGATPHLPNVIEHYSYAQPYYIFNVCAHSQYRGQGLAKSLMISAINDLIGSGIRSFMLEVKPDNYPAYTLYTSLGFTKIDSVTDFGKVFDVLYLSL